ncbi:MAG: hypothetical protein OXC15_20255 [Rhodospirillaceae bacterium]|nr:hypothetical protein [Rhodospirillaceae bacterium]
MSSFGDELRALGKRRIGLPELRTAWLRAHPEARDQPEQRRLLLDALRGLEREGRVDLPGRGWDTSGSPALPRTARLRDAAQGRRTRTPQAWLPALAFAADERHPVRRADLQAVNAFLLSVRGREPVPAPTRERSLQIFGDEKRLDDLRKGGPALFEGRVPLDDLHCYPVAPPLPHETPPKRAPGRPILVLENYHSWDSFRRWNRHAALYAAIAYGGGNAFRQGAGNLDDVIENAQAEGAMYLGDLDPAGVRILIGVNRRRQSEGREGLRPHRGLYRWLLAHGRRRPLERSPDNAEVDGLGDAFPAGLAKGLAELWSEGRRIPQESFGIEQLSGAEASIAAPDAG